jgi:hypothetical protein
MIQSNGGEVNDSGVRINIQTAEPVPLEQNFTGYRLSEEIPVNRLIGVSDPQEFVLDFQGIGIVLRGRVKNKNFMDVYALQTKEQTLNDFSLETEFYIDGDLVLTSLQPLAFIKRNHELFYIYELPEGEHTLKMVIKNPNPDVLVDIYNAITYTK